MRLGKVLGAARISSVAVLGLLIASLTPALAYQTELIGRYRHWQADHHLWDDGRSACRAMVGDSRENFALWLFDDGQVQLQFFASAWHFGAAQPVDLHLRVDTRPRWRLPQVVLRDNSATLTLADLQAADQMIAEFIRGNKLTLSNQAAKPLQVYSLIGFRNALRAAQDCQAKAVGG